MSISAGLTYGGWKKEIVVPNLVKEVSKVWIGKKRVNYALLCGVKLVEKLNRIKVYGFGVWFVNWTN